MNFKINRLFLIFVVAIIPYFLQAARMFILFNEDCMERLEYQSANKNVDAFVAYQINVGDGEKVILEIGQESKNTTTKLPTPTIGCDNGIFNLPMVQKINNRIDEVFLVVKKNNRRYTVSPINFATYFSVQNEVISVNSPKYQFEFNTKEGSIGENISTEANADVFFEGRLEQECTGAYVFRQIAEGSRTPYTDLILIPEVGIIEIRAGQTLDQALSNSMRLVEVNEDSFEKYLKEKCDESMPNNVLANTTPGQPKEAEVTPVGPIGFDMTSKQGKIQPANRPSVNTNIPRSATTTSPVNRTVNSNQFHQVQKGETLYRISKMYGVTVDQIKTWNGLNSNLIRTGSQLRVGTGNAISQTQTSPPVNKINAADEEALANLRYYPAPYNTTYRPETNILTARSGSSDTYIVKPGDTVASLAMRFGFTETKFRTINNLGTSDFIKIGQELKTTDCNCPPVNRSSVPTVERPQEFNNFVDTGNNTLDSQQPYPSNPQGSPRSFPVNYSDTPIPVSASNNFNNQSGTNANPGFKYSTPGNTRATSPLYTPRGVSSSDTYGNSSLYNTEQNPASKSQPSPYDAIIPSSFDTYSPITAGSNDTSLKGFNATSPTTGKKMHVVQEGENIFQIARMYGISTERLRALNNLELGEVIIPTQKLYIE